MQDPFLVFDQYLEGSLSQQQIHDFEQQLENDPAWAAQFAEYQQLTSALRQIGLQQLRSTIHQTHTQLKNQGLLLNENDIAAYLNGEMDEPRKKLLERRIKSDPAFKKAADNEKALLERLQSTGQNALKKNIETARQQLQKEGFFDRKTESTLPEKSSTKPTRSSSSPTRSFRFYLSRVAAVALLIMAVGWWLYPSFFTTTLNADQIYTDAFHQKPSVHELFPSDVVKGDTDPTSPVGKTYDDWAAAKSAYTNKDFDQALALINAINPDHLLPNDQPKYRHQLGLLHMIDGQYQMAFDIFEQNTPSQPIYNPTRVQWYQALLLLQLDASKPQLLHAFEQIANDPFNPNATNARKVLEEIDRLE